MNIKTIVSQIKQQYKPEKVILFGSRAYGKPDENSDLDFAIIKDTKKSYHERLIEVRRLVRTTTPIDFFVFTPSEARALKKNNPFVAEIFEKGKVLYEQ